jgi:NADH-quinone oxidoreductase subunit J
MNFNEASFWILAGATVLPAALILCARSIVRMAFLLLVSLAGFAGLYLHLEAGFVGFAQVLVYIGGILVLFLFGVLLTARPDLPLSKKRSAWLLVPGALAGGLVLVSLVFLALAVPWPGGESAPAAGARGETVALGAKLLGKYVLPFEVVSLLLLVAMVGATYMVRGGTGERGDK